MRKPNTPERLYLDFDGFFASCEQFAHPHLRGKPIGVVPFAGAVNTCVIACSREAKKRGVSNVMMVKDALRLCPDLILQPQNPDLYRRAHNALLSEIAMVIPIDAVKSIDELTCRLDPSQQQDPLAVGEAIKARLLKLVGPWIKCSLGYAANRQLAKMACKAGKPDGNMLWHPDDMPGPLLKISIRDVPGIGKRILHRLWDAGIVEMTDLLNAQPKQMRAIWGNVTGERLWYALHGYDIQAQASERGMYGHGRVMPPDHRTMAAVKPISRLLLVKAARRMRRDGWSAGRLFLWLGMWDDSWSGSAYLPAISDDPGILDALEEIWAKARADLPRRAVIARIGVTLGELSRTERRQLDLLTNDEPVRKRLETVTDAIDRLNRRYGRTVVSVGPWVAPPGDHAGGKISYTRIPRAEDFY
ncbi:DNA polymerase IV [Paramagnetospirillum magnetotacticum MS-1]|uniref:DNA-directed DNA polymerase n=1 Tax=Paramagnetospirillum magnetotacticum MS-1 TaxID=272627 RepID=A0A0C2U708_PARME|nr:type VI secretion protein ImpB [Paramagnetospirillum magnetotacticum]KIL97247.1 DNA polymerase IV [Paramagnetospirillum magnetotacticum MS-1]